MFSINRKLYKSWEKERENKFRVKSRVKMWGERWLLKKKCEHFLSTWSWQISSVWHYLLFSSKDLFKMASFLELAHTEPPLPNSQDSLSWESWNYHDFLLFRTDTLFKNYIWTYILCLCYSPLDSIIQLELYSQSFYFSFFF